MERAIVHRSGLVMDRHDPLHDRHSHDQMDRGDRIPGEWHRRDRHLLPCASPKSENDYINSRTASISEQLTLQRRGPTQGLAAREGRGLEPRQDASREQFNLVIVTSHSPNETSRDPGGREHAGQQRRVEGGAKLNRHTSNLPVHNRGQINRHPWARSDCQGQPWRVEVSSTIVDKTTLADSR